MKNTRGKIWQKNATKIKIENDKRKIRGAKYEIESGEYKKKTKENPYYYDKNREE